MVAGRGVVGKRKKEEEEAVTREITEWRCGTIGFFLLVCFDRGGITSEIQMTRGRRGRIGGRTSRGEASERRDDEARKQDTCLPCGAADRSTREPR